jgi:HNH endonuclease
VIRLVKGPKPAVLAANEAAWTAALMAYVQRGEQAPDGVSRRYANDEIKLAVQLETHGKCAYCESKVSHVYPGDVEHMKPKDVYRALTFDWSNLTHVCFRCNNAKRNQYDEQSPPVDPYMEDPALFFIPVGPLVYPQLGNLRGERTIALVKLNRTHLVERRVERFETLKQLIQRIGAAPDDGTKEFLLAEITEQVSDEKEYAFVCRGLLEAYGLP